MPAANMSGDIGERHDLTAELPHTFHLEWIMLYQGISLCWPTNTCTFVMLCLHTSASPCFSMQGSWVGLVFLIFTINKPCREC